MSNLFDTSWRPSLWQILSVEAENGSPGVLYIAKNMQGPCMAILLCLKMVLRATICCSCSDLFYFHFFFWFLFKFSS